jgi:hypothetical protein
MAFLSLTTPLDERIDRWATSGKATRILLHPEDFIKVAKKVDTIEAKYNLPVEVIGGEKALKAFISDSKNSSDDDTVVAVDLTDVDQGDE